MEALRAARAPDRRSLFAHAPVGMAVATPSGVLLDVNPALAALLGRQDEQLLGRSLLEFVSAERLRASEQAHADLQAFPARPVRYETRLTRAEGQHVAVQVTAAWVPAERHGTPAHLVLVVEDITERTELQQLLVHRAMHDPLTGLANRLLFQDRLWHALERGYRERTPTSVLMIDLDDFKKINDALGHPTGDLVLVAFAERLRSVLRASDTATRLGGDEFSIVCENTAPAEAAVLADRLRTAVTDPLLLADHAVQLGLSIGIGSAPGGEEPEQVYDRIIRSADDAMYADKARL